MEKEKNNKEAIPARPILFATLFDFVLVYNVPNMLDQIKYATFCNEIVYAEKNLILI